MRYNYNNFYINFIILLCGGVHCSDDTVVGLFIATHPSVVIEYYDVIARNKMVIGPPIHISGPTGTY